MRLRIGIDARLNAYRHGGIPHYTQQLLEALAPLAPNDEIIVLQHARHRTPLLHAPNVRRVSLFTPPHHHFESWSLPLEIARLRLSVLHLPDFITPRMCPCPTIATIHDLAFLHYPDILDHHAQRYYQRIHQTIHHTNGIIAVSEATRRDIHQLLGIPQHRVDRIYEAAAPVFTPHTVTEPRIITQTTPILPSDTAIPIRHTLHPQQFALFVSTLEPRKNLPTLLHALRLCCDRKPQTPYHLVLAGARGWGETALFQTIRDLRLEPMLTFLGNVTQEELCWLYRACRFYVNPSLYEGFGLPALEALACGAPAIVSTGGSLPEIVGDTALCLPPLDVTAWADALERLWHDESQRATLAQHGPSQAARFSWEQTAQQTLAVYRRIAENR